MSETNVVNLVESLSEAGAEDSTLYKLATIGINSAFNSYRADKDQLMQEFGELPKNIVFEMWDDLESKIKVIYVDQNVASFKEWLKNG